MPNPNATGGYNYVQAENFNQNNTQWMTRVDYNISDNTKLYLRYNLQRETQLFPVGLWWRNGGQVPYPTPVQGKNRSDSVTASLTHVFSPTMTNEFVFGYTFIGFPNVFAGSVEGGPHARSATTTRAFSRTAWRRFRHSGSCGRAKRRWCSIPAGSKRAVRRRVCMPTSTCPASATR